MFHNRIKATSFWLKIVQTLVDYYPELKDQIFANIEEALAISQETGDEDLIIDSKIAMIRCLRSIAGRIDRNGARQTAKELIELLETRHDMVRLNLVYWHLMWINEFMGYFEECIKYCDIGINLASELGIPPVQYPTIKAFALMKLGRYDSAWESLQEEVADEKHLFGKAQKDIGIAEYFQGLMAYKKVIEISKGIIEQGKRLERPWIVSWSEKLLAKSLLQSIELGEVDPDEAIKAISDIEERELTSDVMAELALAKGNLGEALEQAKKAYLREEEWQSKPACASALELQARVLIKRKEPEEAIAIADKGIQIAEEISYLPMLWRLRALKAQALEILDKKEEARQEYESSAKIIRQIADTITCEEHKNDFLSNPVVSSICHSSERLTMSSKK